MYFHSFPFLVMYKRDSSGEIIPPEERGDEFFNDNIPFEGMYINFAKSIVEISNGDIRSMNFTHRSRVSSIVHPTSSFTAAVQDIEDGLVDMAGELLLIIALGILIEHIWISLKLPFHLKLAHSGLLDNV